MSPIATLQIAVKPYTTSSVRHPDSRSECPSVGSSDARDDSASADPLGRLHAAVRLGAGRFSPEVDSRPSRAQPSTARRPAHSTISAVSTTAWNSTSAPAVGPFLRNVLGLVVRQPIDAGAHDHRGRRDAVDPAGVVPGAGDDVPVRIAEPFGRIAHGLDAILVERHRIEMADLLDLEADVERLADRSMPSRMRASIASSVSLSGERMSMVKTVRPAMMLREFG